MFIIESFWDRSSSRSSSVLARPPSDAISWSEFSDTEFNTYKNIYVSAPPRNLNLLWRDSGLTIRPPVGKHKRRTAGFDQVRIADSSIDVALGTHQKDAFGCSLLIITREADRCVAIFHRHDGNVHCFKPNDEGIWQLRWIWSVEHLTSGPGLEQSTWLISFNPHFVFRRTTAGAFSE